jgi:TrmH family RNA methyltransferase
LPVAVAQPEECFTLMRGQKVRVLAAAAEGGVPASGVDLTAPTAILIGNEGRGLPKELIDRADAWISIPCPGPVESLNAGVAASILLYEASRQRAHRARSATFHSLDLPPNVIPQP